MAVDLAGPEDDLVKMLAAIDIVISAVGPFDQYSQIPLANAAKKAGVKRFLPCAFVTVCPPGGVMMLRDWVCIETVRCPIPSTIGNADLNPCLAERRCV